ncbi:site-specific integrase, partial [Streptomyces sp. NPDC006372]
MKESGFATQDKAIARLTEVYNAKKAAPRGQAKADRIARYGAMRFEEYTGQWKAAQRDLGPASVVHLESLLNIHLLPLLGSRRMNTFDHKVVEGFLQALERNGVGLAAQANAFDKLKAILLDANRLGLFDDNPVAGVKPPQYDPKRVVIPSPEQLGQIRAAGDDSFLLVADLMSGCGMRNGEAFAVN